MQEIKRYIERHRLLVFILSVIGVALVLVVISMNIYYSTNAYQLDLSRPDFVSLRPHIKRETKPKDEFDSQGTIDKGVLDDFLRRYREEADRVLKAKAFSSDVLSDEELGINEPE